MALSVLTGLPASAQPVNDVNLELVASGMSSPIGITNAGDARLFVNERGGLIRVLTFDAQGQATVLPTPFLDIISLVKSGGEQGFLGVAFHPDYAANGFFFVNYTCLASAQTVCQSDGDTIIARYSVSADPNVADPSSALVVATIPQDSTNHNGGQLLFEPFPNPTDGRTILYIPTGDGGGGNDPNQNAQNLNSLLGKILRVDVDNLNAADPLPRYHIPSDNPFGDEIWAYGLRNPWRTSFDRQTGDMFIADVGQNAREEVSFQPAASSGGENYGWRQCEGTRVNFAAEAPDGCLGDGGLTPPILEYDHGFGCSVTGGFVYRGPEFSSELSGTYFYGDFCSRTLWGARSDGQGNWSNEIVKATGLTSGITSFGEDQNGELYLATIGGNLYRIKAPPSSLLPDLTLTTVDGPTNGRIGETINVSSTQVQNQGQATAAATQLGFYFTTDPVNEPSQTFSGSTCAVPSLAAGANHNCQNLTVIVPNSLTSGPYRLVGIADDNDIVVESDETNNDLADAKTIHLIDCANPDPENCLDGFDNDCDDLVDIDDPDCQAACTPTGDPCTVDMECCSNKCRGGNNRTCKGEVSCTPTENPETSCADQIDNDCDGLTDGADPTNCSCTITEVPEVSCSNGQDDDCDGLVDSDDPDCQGSCLPRDATCSSNSDCCSNLCRGNGRCK